MSSTEPVYTFGSQPNVPSARSYIRNILILTLVVPALCLLLGSIYYLQQIRPPSEFPVNSTFTIPEGSSVAAITKQLSADNIVRSANLLYFIFLTKYDTTALKAGVYNLTEPLDAHAIAALIAEGDNTANLQRITHVEGDSVAKLAPRLNEILEDFDEDEFIAAATPVEGFLFPDTYLVPPTISTTDLINLMQRRYREAIADIEDQITSHPLSEQQILVLASIIEREANSPTSMKLVSGILQNRLDINMPLQVDASMEYVLEKPLSELAPADLEQDSPYNTYLYPGLPPTPIGNPGLDSITAVLEPTESDYYYYITGTDGQFYYAKTFAEHRNNITRYLR